MDISKLTDQAKSVLLARAVGKSPEHDQIVPQWMIMIPGIARNNKEMESVVFDLYRVDENGEPVNMPLSWRVLNWACVTFHMPPENKLFIAFYTSNGWWTLFCADPATAMRLWLDEILKLAIEAGRIELEEERG